MAASMMFKPSMIGHVVELSISMSVSYPNYDKVPDGQKNKTITKAGILAAYAYDDINQELAVQFRDATGEQKYNLNSYSVFVYDVTDASGRDL
jgi:hypothetical protein